MVELFDRQIDKRKPLYSRDTLFDVVTFYPNRVEDDLDKMDDQPSDGVYSDRPEGVRYALCVLDAVVQYLVKCCLYGMDLQASEGVSFDNWREAPVLDLAYILRRREELISGAGMTATELQPYRLFRRIPTVPFINVYSVWSGPHSESYWYDCYDFRS